MYENCDIGHDLKMAFEDGFRAGVEVAQPKWISVEDRLPEAYGDGSVDAVLVTDGSFIHMAYFSCGKWCFCESGEMKEEMFYSVTHWMPLPSTEGLDDA